MEHSPQEEPTMTDLDARLRAYYDKNPNASLPRALVAYADGACDLNPGGTATYGWVIFDEQGQELMAASGIVVEGPRATNNAAEFAAAHQALARVGALALPPGSTLTLRGDAKLWVNMLNGRGQPQTLDAPYVPYYKLARAELRRLRKAGITVVIEWVPRERNTRADELSKQPLPMASPWSASAPPATDAVLPFGRFRGRAISTLPAAYLTWLLDQPWLHTPLRGGVLLELETRFERSRGSAPLTNQGDSR
jgi:ribonuclease H / adenosylcobalamin/alpha-ribazole phosphatase